MLFLHGNPDTKESWARVLELLADAPLRCHAPDLPGFGESEAPGGPGRPELTLDAFARWTGALLATLTSEAPSKPVHLVVHDVGGFYGLPFAAAFPERVASLTILNTLFWPDYRWHRFGRAWRTPLLGELVMACAGRRLAVHEMRRGSKGYPVAEALATYARITPRAKRHVLRLYRAMSPAVFAPWEPRLLEATQGVPTQVIWGERDPYIPKHFAARFGTEQVERLPSVGHWPQIERPDLVAQRIREFALGGGGSPS